MSEVVDVASNETNKAGSVSGLPVYQKDSFKAFIGITSGVALLVIPSLVVMPPVIPVLVSTFVTCYLAKSLFVSAYRSLTNKTKDEGLPNRFTMVTLYTLNILLLTANAIASLFLPWLAPMTYLAPMVLGIWYIGEFVEGVLINKINRSARIDLRDSLPKTVIRITEDGDKSVELGELQAGDIIKLMENQMVPVDCELYSNSAEFNCENVDGTQNKTIIKGNGSQAIQSGMIVVSDHVEIKVKKDYKSSSLYQTEEALSEGRKSLKSHASRPMDAFINKLIKIFVPTVAVIALVSGVTLALLSYPIPIILQCVVSVMMSVCPCALSSVVPLVKMVAHKKGGKNGVNFNQAIYDLLAECVAFIFDLNGTLTEGNTTITVDHGCSMTSEQMQILLQIEQRSDHPVAQAIVQHISPQLKHTSKSSHELGEIEKKTGGVVVRDGDDKEYFVGNRDLLPQGINLPDDNNNCPLAPQKIYFGRGDEVICQFTFSDNIRPEVTNMIDKLKEMGKTVYLCTGADEHTAKFYAKGLGIPDKNLGFSQDTAKKGNYVTEIGKKSGKKVLFLGNGLNDRSALNKADVRCYIKPPKQSPEMSKSTAQALPDTDIELQEPTGLIPAIDIARKANFAAKAILVTSLTYNLLAAIVASGAFVSFGLVLSPVAAVTMMVIESLVVLSLLIFFCACEVKTIKEQAPQPFYKRVFEWLSTNETGDHKDYPSGCFCPHSH